MNNISSKWWYSGGIESIKLLIINTSWLNSLVVGRGGVGVEWRIHHKVSNERKEPLLSICLRWVSDSLFVLGPENECVARL